VEHVTFTGTAKTTLKRSLEKLHISGKILPKLILKEMVFQRVDWVREGTSGNTGTVLVP
jgi:hypothetical protein